jgi:hypothetical protein
MNFKKLAMGAAIVTAVAGPLASTQSSATTIATLTSCAVTGGCGSATTFGTIDLTGTTYTVTLTGGFQFFASGSGAQPFFAFNTTSGTAVFGTITGTGANLTGVNGTTPPGNPPGGIGSMNNYITTTSDSTPIGSSLAFVLTGSYVLGGNGPNGTGDTFAADICTAVANGACSGNTGWIDATLGPSPVPIPSAALLFGTGLAGLGILGRRRRRSKARA